MLTEFINNFSKEEQEEHEKHYCFWRSVCKIQQKMITDLLLKAEAREQSYLSMLGFTDHKLFKRKIK